MRSKFYFDEWRNPDEGSKVPWPANPKAGLKFELNARARARSTVLLKWFLL